MCNEHQTIDTLQSYKLIHFPMDYIDKYDLFPIYILFIREYTNIMDTIEASNWLLVARTGWRENTNLY